MNSFPFAAFAPALSVQSDFGIALVAGLSARYRAIPPKYFYDSAGSALFDRICHLPEYYPTRTEIAILKGNAREIAGRIGPRTQIIEFGAGSVVKIRALLDSLLRPECFVPIDISGEHLRSAVKLLQRDYPEIAMTPIVGDFTHPTTLRNLPTRGRRIGFFPGSSIGNFTPEECVCFLREAASTLRGGGLLIGVDLVKDPAVLHAAYNDSAGVTAAFNRNVLARANRELDANFEPEAFAHYAFYNAPQRRIEMHLVSLMKQTAVVAGREFSFDEGETIHTENSYKFTVEGFQSLTRAAGFVPDQVWCDDEERFSLHWLEAPI